MHEESSVDVDLTGGKYDNDDEYDTDDDTKVLTSLLCLLCFYV